MDPFTAIDNYLLPDLWFRSLGSAVFAPMEASHSRLDHWVVVHCRHVWTYVDVLPAPGSSLANTTCHCRLPEGTLKKFRPINSTIVLLLMRITLLGPNWKCVWATGLPWLPHKRRRLNCNATAKRGDHHASVVSVGCDS